MAALVAAIHFPEAVQALLGLLKMDGRDKPGHDGMETLFHTRWAN
jgi:hypothetical protein